MSDTLGFLRAIHAAPDDDLPRIVLADYWEENGKPSVRRAEGRLRVHYMKWYREYLKARNDYDDPPFTLTEKALEYDREFLAKHRQPGAESA